MAKTTHTAVTVGTVSRGPVSAMGNPSYIFHTSKGLFRTQANSGAAYGLENDFHLNEIINEKVTLEITASGRVVSWEKH